MFQACKFCNTTLTINDNWQTTLFLEWLKWYLLKDFGLKSVQNIFRAILYFRWNCAQRSVHMTGLNAHMHIVGRKQSGGILGSSLIKGSFAQFLRVKENVTEGQIVNFLMAYLSFGFTLVGSGPDFVSPDSCVLVEFASLLTVPSSFGLQSSVVLRAMQCQNKASSVQFRFQCSQEH